MGRVDNRAQVEKDVPSVKCQAPSEVVTGGRMLGVGRPKPNPQNPKPTPQHPLPETRHQRPFPPADVDLYESNLYPSSEAEPLPCSARAIIYCPTLVAALIALLVKRSATGE